MADTLIAGTTLVEKESRSAGDIPIGGITEWDDTFATIPENFRLCNGATVNDPTSSYNGSAVPDLNTNYYTINSAAFTAASPDVNNVTIDVQKVRADADGIQFSCPINLPNGATVTAVIFNGNAGATAETWTLYSKILDGTTLTSMATAAFDTEDTTITSATIDNENANYGILTSTMDTNDEIYSGRITYTPRFKFIIRIK